MKYQFALDSSRFSRVGGGHPYRRDGARSFNLRVTGYVGPGDGVGLLGPGFISGFGRIVEDAEAGNEAVKAARASSVKVSLP
jgi:hypothetical protein